MRKTNTLNLQYILISVIAVILTWLLHEFAHWAAGEALGNDMVMTANTGYPVSGAYKEPWHALIIDSAGPAITIIQAVVIFVLLKSRSTILLFPFLLTCLYMRIIAGGLNVINLNDEGRISNTLGLGTWIIPALVIALLFFLVYKTVKARKISTKVVTITILIIMVISSAIVLGDQVLKIRLL
jgi:hypothetical protein